MGVRHVIDLQGGGRGGGQHAVGCDERGAGGDGDGGDVVRREQGVSGWVCELGDDGRRRHDGERGELRDEKVRFFLVVLISIVRVFFEVFCIFF